MSKNPGASAPPEGTTEHPTTPVQVTDEGVSITLPEELVLRGWRQPAIYRLLIEAKRRIGGVPKSQRFGDGSDSAVSYNFRGVDQVVNAVAGVFMDLGIVGPVPEVEWSDHQVMEHQKSNARGSYIQYAYRHQVRVRYTFIAAEDGSSMEVVTEGEAIDYSDKGTAKATSVALRVALLQALTLPTTDPDPDSERPEINKPTVEQTETVVWNEDDNRKLRDFLKEQTAQVQRSAKVFIRSQRIPLSKLQATEDQLNTIEEFVRELLDEEAERRERIAENEATTTTLDERVAAAKASTRERLGGES